MAVRKLTYRTWKKKLEDGEQVNGLSPGGAASELGITRQAVHQLLESGRLDAVRVEDRGTLIAICIDPGSVEAYRVIRGFRQTAGA